MADFLLDKLLKLQQAIAALQEENRKLAERNSGLEAENVEMRIRTEEAEEKRRQAELDVEFLRMSHRLADNPDSIIETRRHIAGLIRNIDRCLEMLKE